MFAALKAMLAERKLGYRFLAQQTGQSVTNVKRIFAQKTCSLEKLGEFCDALGVGLFGLMERARGVPTAPGFSSEAEAFLAGHLHYFHFWQKLVALGSPSAVRKALGLPLDQMLAYTDRLEALGLIERLPHDAFRCRLPESFVLPRGGPLHAALAAAWCQTLVPELTFTCGRLAASPELGLKPEHKWI